MSEQVDSQAEQEPEMSFLDHLEVLRWHIIKSLASIVFFGILAFIFHGIIFDKILLAPKSPDFFTNKLLCDFGKLIGSESICINNKPFQIISIEMAGQFSAHISVSIVAGLILAFPYIFWQFWSFVQPALYNTEQRHARGAVFWSSLLFMLGVLFGFYLIVPLSVHFLGSYNVSDQVVNQISLISYISTVTSVVLAAGVIFELPILIFFLAKAGLVTPQFLRNYRKHALVVILIVSAVITPPDVFSQILVSGPLFLLYEASIVITKNIERKERDLLV
ncbi:MAG: hypothetical protein RIS47_2252 [Bacteroidota bacterium]|jgi:sec-independent protein translocase protein TatC